MFGPPGTGKTTSLSHNLERAAERVGAANVFCASFTRAAATELASRVQGFPKDRIGTLHSHGYRAIGAPTLISGKILAEWNEQYPSLALPPKLYDREGRDTADPFDDSSFFDDDTPEKRHEQYQTLRARMVRREAWPESVRAFGERWEAWKEDQCVIDFTDMIERALEQATFAPGAPAIGFFDEVQDFTPLELALVRQWGSRMEQIVLAGDDDQMIYGFKGASVDAFLDESVEPASVRVLAQSYRVPRAVHAAATSWIGQVKRRQEKPYRPRDEDGVAHVLWDQEIEDGERIVKLIEDRLGRGMTVMVMADAARMLKSVVRALKDAGVPFHNPFASQRGDWNPLGGGRGVSCAARLVALSRYDTGSWGEDARRWAADEVAHWVDPLRADGVFARGGKSRAQGLDASYTLPDLAACFADGFADGGALDRCGSFDLDWYRAHLTKEYAARMQFPLAVARKRGARELAAPPRVLIGTIHSFKGAEADCVILASDLSYFHQQDLDEGGDDADNVVRLFYVGMTRARHELIVTAPSSHRSIHPHDLIGKSA
jgi:DNA helicase-2/ATP-dependent DNA helicase PcrA